MPSWSLPVVAAISAGGWVAAVVAPGLNRVAVAVLAGVSGGLVAVAFAVAAG